MEVGLDEGAVDFAFVTFFEPLLSAHFISRSVVGDRKDVLVLPVIASEAPASTSGHSFEAHQGGFLP